MEKRSGSKLSTESEDAQPHLSDHEIRQLLQQAEANRAEDQKWLKLTEARIRAEEAIDRAEARLRGSQEVGLWDARREIEQALATLGVALQQGDNPEEIHARAGELEKLVQYAKADFSFGAFDDLFSFFAATPKARSKPTRGRATEAQPPLKDTISKRTSQETRPASELAASQRIGDQIGKIFGRGEFTLDPNLCFVLMPFAEQMRPIYDDHIRPIVESEGLSCLRADEIMGTNVITRDIWEKMNRARFIIADLTGRNPNVFYEVGIAHTLGKEVILLTQSMNDVPFDLKALRCIVYSYTPRGMRDMEKRLQSTIKEIMRSS